MEENKTNMVTEQQKSDEIGNEAELVKPSELLKEKEKEEAKPSALPDELEETKDGESQEETLEKIM